MSPRAKQVVPAQQEANDLQSGQPKPAASTAPRRRWPRLLVNRRLWAVVILLVGLWLIFFFGTRTMSAYREFTYAREQGLLNGTATVEAIQPWMTIRYIAVAYAVPEEYIYAKLKIPFNRRSAREPLGHLARQQQEQRARPAPAEPPPDPDAAVDALLAEVRAIILAYRENPVAWGLRDIRPWMSLAYIANSTGVPVDYLVGAVAANAAASRATKAAEPGSNDGATLRETIDSEENRYKPLDLLSADLHYPGGPEQLYDVVRSALALHDHNDE